MRVKKAQDALSKLARTSALDLRKASAADALRLMLDFYRSFAADDVSADDGDMLLYSWGVCRSLSKASDPDDSIAVLRIAQSADPPS